MMSVCPRDTLLPPVGRGGPAVLQGLALRWALLWMASLASGQVVASGLHLVGSEVIDWQPPSAKAQAYQPGRVTRSLNVERKWAQVWEWHSAVPFFGGPHCDFSVLLLRGLGEGVAVPWQFD